MRDKTPRAAIIGHPNPATCKYLHPSSKVDTHYSKSTRTRACSNGSNAFLHGTAEDVLNVTILYGNARSRSILQDKLNVAVSKAEFTSKVGIN